MFWLLLDLTKRASPTFSWRHEEQLKLHQFDAFVLSEDKPSCSSLARHVRCSRRRRISQSKSFRPKVPAAFPRMGRGNHVRGCRLRKLRSRRLMPLFFERGRSQLVPEPSTLLGESISPSIINQPLAETAEGSQIQHEQHNRPS